MAGDWIKFEVVTSDKPEVWAIAADLGIDPDAVVGKLLRVWAWFDQQTENGVTACVTKALLDRAVGVTGFCKSIIDVGWMIDDGTNITITNFERHNGASAKKRAETNRRVAKHREEKRNGNNKGNANGNKKDVTKTVTREEKRREEKEEDSCSVQADANFEINDKDQNPSFSDPPFQPEPKSAKALVDEADNGGDEDLLDIPSFLDRRTPDQRAPGKFPTLKALGSGPARKYPAEFERFWATFPKRATDTKAQAYTAWLKGVKAVGVDTLQSAAEAYANFCAAKDHPSKLVATWINAEGWTAEYGAVGGGDGGEAQTPYQAALSGWYGAKERAEAKGDHPPPKPQREDFV